MSSRKNHVRTRCVYAAHIIVYVQNGVFAITTMATMKSAAFRAETEIDLFESNEPVPPPVVVAAAAAPTGRRLGARGEFSVPVALCPAVGPRTIWPVVPDTPSPLSPREGERLISLIFSRSEIIQGMKKKNTRRDRTVSAENRETRSISSGPRARRCAYYTTNRRRSRGPRFHPHSTSPLRRRARPRTPPLNVPKPN